MQPKRQKHRKQFKGKRRGIASRGAQVAFGEFGLKSLGRAWLSAQQIEAARRAIAHTTARGGKVWIRVFPDKPVTSRGPGVRMGGGKGDVSKYVAVILPGRIIFELAGTSEAIAHEAFERAAAKLPFETKIVNRV
ncbi:MAG: 50S ribosomal protein L16 [Candidatus Blackburnbacteria bacterium RIFCSPLOWO2_01_FULL_41_27]|uniref:Large ribosomal subunit protein uL16 n=2 Tax=Candidatus Blackburniibacteriota TaxID=1817898 RepID=A0A1G1VA06_9BACT|nr:MAG: 50S ribosomal protein L16 [Candidatus Blackburnbacteria bacterium RIFCSPHIGHO2_12_FULL_41_13b]OGY14830.1 MAG: 50S ribosomal protein L16 [Candidatus Blackburnbacteria bacterium RIFCSPLOWO2_01_FULL_41_27]